MVNKKILFFAILLIGVFFVSSAVQAATTAVNGWAWSDNIGWIEMAPASGGVFIDDTSGNFSGYSWSDNIGWIDFTDTKLDWLTGQVSGWAKAVAGNAASGWDGWISMRGTSPAYGVNVNQSTGDFSGYAWGADVVGWVDFSKVTTSAITPLLEEFTLSVSLTANPSSGNKPMNSILKADVSGTATGTINYKFDCNNDGNFEEVFNNVTEETETYSCNYSNAGSYTAKVYVERGTLNDQATVAIAVGDPDGPPVVSITANPNLIDYNTYSTLTWSAVNAITCTASGDWVGLKNPVTDSETMGNITSSKTYILTCSGPKGTASKSVTVQVNLAPIPKCTLSANPSSGQSPLLDVLLTASGSGGSGTGYEYRFDYTNDGIYDTLYSDSKTSTHTYIADNPTDFTATAEVRDSNGTPATCATSVRILGELSVSLSADPSSNPSPLTTDLTAAVEGTATGTINYTLWWNCDNAGTNVPEVRDVCGNPNDSSIGAKYDNILNTSIKERHTYPTNPTKSAYTDYAKVIVERGDASPAQNRKRIDIGPPVPYFRLNNSTGLHATIIEKQPTITNATTITVTPVNNFNSDVLLSAQWKDSGTDAEFIFSDNKLSFSEYNIGTGSTFKVKVLGTAKPGLYTIIIKGIADDADGFPSTEEVTLNIESVSTSEIWEF